MKLPAIAACLMAVFSFGSAAILKEAPADDIFSSISKMEALVHQENNIVNMLDSFLVDAKQRINIIQKWVIITTFFVSPCRFRSWESARDDRREERSIRVFYVFHFFHFSFSWYSPRIHSRWKCAFEET